MSWLVGERLAGKTAGIRTKALRGLLVLVWGTALALEIPYHFAPRLESGVHPRLYIFADSVTAGMGEKGVKTWPKLLQERRALAVTDFSQMGANVKTMVKKAESVALGDGIVLLEIGGNDLLGSTSAEEFETHLDALLHVLSGPGRVVLMFELPLPPLRNAFGLAQRRLASKHGALLIPKRIFICVLTADKATVDSIHLSPQGHELMAETIWNLISEAYAK